MEDKVINLAINTFQNVGIKRWIDDVQMLRNQSIYFEICKVIFPQMIIRMYKIDEDNETSEQKIQELINLVSKQIDIELHHISGKAIVEGNIKHMKNFMELLEGLTQTHCFVNTCTLHSAPQIDSSKIYNDNSFYTVIGISNEFQIKSNQQENADTNIPNVPNESDTNPSNNPEQPTVVICNDPSIFLENTDKNTKKQNIKNPKRKKQRLAQPYKKKQISKYCELYNKKTRSESAYTQTETIPNKSGNSSSLRKIMMKKKKINYINKTNYAIELLQRKKIYNENHLFKGWKTNKINSYDLKNNQINVEANKINKILDIKLTQRQKIVNSLKQDQLSTNVILNTFKLERKIYKQIKKQLKQYQFEVVNKIMNESFGNEISLQQAALSSIVNFERE